MAKNQNPREDPVGPHAENEPAAESEVAAEEVAEDAAADGASAAEAERVADAEPAADPDLSEADLEILDGAQQDLIAELRDDALRARAELVNFRTRVERDRQANREANIAEVLRALLPALDDLDRAEQHGDIAEGTPMAIIATKLRGAFGRFGLQSFGAVGDPFDPTQHEAIFQQPVPGAEGETVLDVVELGYRFGERVVRPAKVAVAVPAGE